MCGFWRGPAGASEKVNLPLETGNLNAETPAVRWKKITIVGVDLPSTGCPAKAALRVGKSSPGAVGGKLTEKRMWP
jgi:hypothetical protein